jgi:hypothetical protein
LGGKILESTEMKISSITKFILHEKNWLAIVILLLMATIVLNYYHWVSIQQYLPPNADSIGIPIFGYGFVAIVLAAPIGLFAYLSFAEWNFYFKYRLYYITLSINIALVLLFGYLIIDPLIFYNDRSSAYLMLFNISHLLIYAGNIAIIRKSRQSYLNRNLSSTSQRL